MGRPTNRHHPRHFKSPTWSFGTHTRPPDDTPEERAEKERLVAEYLAKKREGDK